MNPVSSIRWGDPAEQCAPASRRPGVVFSREDSLGSESKAAAPSILLVEDDFLIAMQIETAFAGAGLGLVGIASSAEEAVEMAAVHRPVLAIMDIRLAGKRDGIDAALELFRDYGIRCIFATAHSDPDTSRRAAPARPLGWLQKPYTMTSLIEAVQAAFVELGLD